MCPGGTVVAATSDERSVVTNGMSAFSRDGENSNAAFLVSVTPNDFGTTDPLGGIALQQKIERAAYLSGGGDYKAPAINMEDFVASRTPSSRGITPTYPRGTVRTDTREYLPDFITDSIRAAISDFDDWMPGFYYPDAILTGAETRSTSPVRILRDETMQVVGFRGVYTAGEGGGYSGGIISSAADGVRAAIALLEKYL
jgi:uncharacterized FAD-dependent dehydrogenase